LTTPELSLLVVNYNTWRLCVEAVETFAAHPPTRADGSAMPYEVIVVDNASPQRDAAAEAELRALCEASGGALVLHGENGGYSTGMNLAYARARGRFVLVSNPDIRYLGNTVDPLLRAMERDASIGAAAPRGFWDVRREGLLPPNILPTMGDLWRLTLAALSPTFVRRYARRRTRDALPIWTAAGDVELPMLSGCCFLMRRELIEEIGFFDERFPLYYEDTDLSVRIVRAGRRIVQVGGSEVVHLFDRSGQTDPTLKMERYWRSRRLYYRKWYGRLGALCYDLSRWVQNTRFGKRRATLSPHAAVHDLGVGHGKPVLRLPRRGSPALIEFALDPKFFLAGGILVDGDSWMPNDEMYKAFGPTTYWFRVVDAGDPRQPVLGIYRYQQLHPAVAMPHSPEADAYGRSKLRHFQETGRWS
jgi:GT2 family glycosyltransferase